MFVAIAHAAIPILLIATCLTWCYERIATAPVIEDES